MTNENRSAYVKILEEPAAKALRFRYECEGRSAGSLPGANSNHDKKTFPKIQVITPNTNPPTIPQIIRGVVVVSCVTCDPPYRPHPHNLVGKEGCKKGVCTMEISTDDMSCEFSNLGIQCVKKKDIEDSLRVREEIRVDPFRTGFVHKSQPGSIDLNAVRLCFQVFLEGPERGQFKVPLKPVVSEPIYDKKAINDLTIMKLSDCTSPVVGNKEIILLCDKVSKDDIEIRFYEESEQGQLVWEAFGDFQPSDVHKQYAISFRTPQFRDMEITNPTRVQIQLRCPSKDTTSVPRPFDYLPLSSETGEGLKRKRLKQFNASRVGSYIEESANNSEPFNNIPAFIKRPRASYPPPQPVPQNIPQNPPNILSPEGQPQGQPPGHVTQPQGQTSGGGIINYYGNIKTEPEYYEQNYNYNYNDFNQFRQPTNPITNPQPGPSQQPQNYYTEQKENSNMDIGNISLPNLSDVNLSLLESHLSENFNENLNISGSQF